MSEITNNQPIGFSSTGGLGAGARQDNRWYDNHDEFITDPAELEAVFDDLIRHAGTGLTRESAPHRDEYSRVVFRGIVSSNVMHALPDSSLGQRLEIALPLDDFGHPYDWLIYLAQNHPSRQALQPLEEMMAATEYATRDPEEPRQYVAPAAENLAFHDMPEASSADQLLEQWGGTFGWDEADLNDFIERMHSESRQVDPSRRQAFFNAAYIGERLVSVTMAERLSLPGRNGQPLSLVETTECRTRQGYEGRGLMTELLLRQGYDIRIPNALNYVEGNFTTRFDRAAHKAGFRKPSTEYAAQMAIQNVRVYDGFDPVDGLRDFTFMYRPGRSV